MLSSWIVCLIDSRFYWFYYQTVHCICRIRMSSELFLIRKLCCCLIWMNNLWIFYHLQSFDMFSTVSMASQSEITRRLEESSLENHQLDEGSPRFLSRSEISHGEHPLSLGKTSIWNQFFQVILCGIFVNACHVASLIPSFSMPILYLNM